MLLAIWRQQVIAIKDVNQLENHIPYIELDLNEANTEYINILPYKLSYQTIKFGNPEIQAYQSYLPIDVS